MGMTTFNGEKVSLTAGAPNVNTLGISLGRIARFCGHCELHYTVLCHSLTVAALLPPAYGIHGLMHDTPESLVSDVPTPMKSQVARSREGKLLERIYITAGLPWPIPDEALEAVAEADHLALIAEAHVLKHRGEWGEPDPHAVALTKKHLKKVSEYIDLAGTGVAGAVFERAFKKYSKLAGFDESEWV